MHFSWLLFSLSYCRVCSLVPVPAKRPQKPRRLKKSSAIVSLFILIHSTGPALNPYSHFSHKYMYWTNSLIRSVHMHLSKEKKGCLLPHSYCDTCKREFVSRLHDCLQEFIAVSSFSYELDNSI